MDKEFKAAYARLNTAQRQAVDGIDGPMLVVAGPGTGKTELLSTRVANILKKTDADASNILCLTFTNKAALNMRDRLYKQIGSESRYVVVRTFHSFAAEIMNNYPDYFWSGARLSVAPEAVQLEILQSILAKLPHKNPLSSTFAGTFTFLNDVQNALKLVKEAGLAPDELRKIIKNNLKFITQIEPTLVDIVPAVLSLKNLTGLQSKVNKLTKQVLHEDSLLLPLDVAIKQSLANAIEADLPTNKTKETGKWKRRWLQTIDGKKGMFKERKRNEWWLAVADVYEEYREQLPERGYYDYDDMLIEVLQQLEKEPDMLADVQERFQYVLIDEFQDTNAAQLRLAHQVADHYSANGKPNIMAVGDDDQAIFTFNGAELNNMLGFRQSYPSAKLIVLTENYRSAQPILDTASLVIIQAEERLVTHEKSITKQLKAKQPGAKKSQIEHVSYPTRQHQQLALARRIKELWQAKQGSIVVLARKHESLRQLAAILLNQEVPVRYEHRSNVLEHPAVKQAYLIANLAVAIAEGDQKTVNVNLAELVRHAMWDIKPRLLWALAKANFSSADWLDSLLTSHDPKLQAMGDWLVWLARLSQDNSLTLAMDHILGLEESEYLRSPFRDYYLSPRQLSSDYLETLSAVELLRGLAEEFAGKEEASLADFVRFVELNLNTKRVIADESWFTGEEQSVNLLTVYKAKGLEFDHVFVVDAIEGMWQPRTARHKSPANLRLQAYGENYDDYVRLLYVAISRAKQNFVATSYYSDDKGEELLPTPLLSAIPAKIIKEPEDEPIEVLEADLRWPRLSTNNERGLLADRLEEFSLNQGALIDFLNVAEAGPASFIERHLLRLPRARSPQGSYGTAIHAALETAQRLVNNGKLEVGTVLDRFESALTEEHLPKIDYERYHGRGLSLLKSLFKEGGLSLNPGGLSEQRIKDIKLEQAVINGKIDRIDVTPSEILVSDYKTGKPLSSFETQNKSHVVKAWRHRIQLLFYSLLTRESRRFPSNRPIRAQMLYLEASNPRQLNLSLEPTEEDLLRLRRLVETVYAHVTQLKFPDTAGYSPNLNGIKAFETDLLDGKV